jgi:hypothetical protein
MEAILLLQDIISTQQEVFQKTIGGKSYKTLGVTYFYFERVYKVNSGVVTRTDDFVQIFEYIIVNFA